MKSYSYVSMRIVGIKFPTITSEHLSFLSSIRNTLTVMRDPLEIPVGSNVVSTLGFSINVSHARYRDGRGISKTIV